MFSTFVGLGRFINCQRPDHTVHHAFVSTDFPEILFRIFALLSDIPEYVSLPSRCLLFQNSLSYRLGI